MSAGLRGQLRPEAKGCLIHDRALIRLKILVATYPLVFPFLQKPKKLYLDHR